MEKKSEGGGGRGSSKQKKEKKKQVFFSSEGEGRAPGPKPGRAPLARRWAENITLPGREGCCCCCCCEGFFLELSQFPPRKKV